MISTKVPQDLRRYNVKTVLIFTTRQFVFLLLTIILDGAIYSLFLKNMELNYQELIIILMIISLPTLVIGFYSYMGMTIEVYIKDVFLLKYLAPQKRIVKNVIYDRPDLKSYYKLNPSKRKRKEKNNPNLKQYL